MVKSNKKTTELHGISINSFGSLKLKKVKAGTHKTKLDKIEEQLEHGPVVIRKPKSNEVKIILDQFMTKRIEDGSIIVKFVLNMDVKKPKLVIEVIGENNEPIDVIRDLKGIPSFLIALKNGLNMFKIESNDRIERRLRLIIEGVSNGN